MTETTKLRECLENIIEVIDYKAIDYFDGNLLQMPAAMYNIRALAKEALDTTGTPCSDFCGNLEKSTT